MSANVRISSREMMTLALEGVGVGDDVEGVEDVHVASVGVGTAW